MILEDSNTQSEDIKCRRL